MSLPEPENNMPSRDDGNGGDNTNNIDGERRESDTKKSFDLATFHQLRLERWENQKRAEQQSRQRNGQKSRLRWSSSASSSSSMMDSSIKTVQSRSFQASSNAIEKNTIDKLSARRELLRLGQRYASFSLSVQQGRLPSPEQTSWGNTTENAELQKALFPSPTDTDSSPATHISESEGSSLASEKAVIHHSPHFLDITSRSYSVPLEAFSHHDNGISLVTPDVKNASKENVGVYGSQYLLLARTNYSPTPTSKIDHDGGANIIDADDGSSSASYNTPTPHLQAASACNSQGDNEDGCEAQEDVEVETDHFSSFCKAQILISEIEDNALRQLEVASMCPSEADTKNDNLVPSNKTNVQRIVYYVVRSALVTIAGAALFFYWRYIVSWCKLTYPRLSPLLSAQLNSWLHSMTAHSWSLETIQSAFYSKMADGVKQASSLHGHATSHLTLWANVLWRTTVTIYSDWTKDIVTIYTDWTKDVDMLSWIIHNIYRLEKLYYDALQLFNETKCSFSEVQDSSVVAWNATLSVAISCWQHLEGAPMSHFFYKSKEHIVIRKATLTTPIIFCSNDGCISKTLANETLALLDNGDDVKSINESSSPQFWRKSINGTPFVRHQLPSMRHDFRRCIHSIPSLGTQPEGSDSSRTHWHISISPAFNELQHPDERSKSLFPVVGLGRSRLSLVSHRLDNILISTDIRKSLAASMIMQKSRRRNSEHIPPHQQSSQAMITKERNYYKSSYPTQEQSHEKDIFDDVNVMSMAREFVGQLLQRRSSNTKWSSTTPNFSLYPPLPA